MNKLHFGCFNCPHEGWLNSDITPHIYIARIPGLAWLIFKIGKMTHARYEEHKSGIFKKIIYLNVSKKWHFKDASFKAICSSHVLEHLTLAGAKNCVAESYRCLSKGGVLRLSLPDLDLMIREFQPQNSLVWATNFFEANENSEKNMHHFMYNYSSLSELLINAGFSQINRRNYKEGICPDVQRIDNRPDSLFIEAIK